LSRLFRPRRRGSIVGVQGEIFRIAHPAPRGGWSGTGDGAAGVMEGELGAPEELCAG
jgi:hypothetical protein